jgi:hypothetical protein
MFVMKLLFASNGRVGAERIEGWRVRRKRDDG